MLFRQLYDAESSTYTYLLADPITREAVLIDPVIEQLERDRQIVQDLELRLLYTLDTHVHADHVTASGALRSRLGSSAVISERSATACADRLVKHGDFIRFGSAALEVRETPGHTNGCVTYVTEDHRLAFTGDALLIRGCGRTDFQQGDARKLYESVRGQVFSLPDDTLVYPAHDYKGRTCSSVGEEKRLNPRLGSSRSLAEFVAIMADLKLPYPKKIDLAVPANLRCGELDISRVESPSYDGSWGPIEVSGAGVPEITPEWVATHHGEVRIIDVREPEEYRGELGHVPGAELVPLSTLEAAARAWPAGDPIVTVCRSGGRSAKAAATLGGLGLAKVASLRGGMLAWSSAGLLTEYGSGRAAATSRQG